ncbi:MAG: endonuclease domain-containing protein [Armatimonadota bacterium]
MKVNRREKRLVRGVADAGKLEFAKEQRQEPTWAENQLWQLLRRKALGVRFRRQHPIGDFVLDFYCAPARLAVEVDGTVHDEQEGYDNWRDDWLNGQGIRVLRVSDEEVKKNMEGVLEKIRRELDERL